MLQPVINKAHVSINLKKEVRAISSFQGSFQGERKGSALWAPGEGAGLRIRKQYKNCNFENQPAHQICEYSVWKGAEYASKY